MPDLSQHCRDIETILSKLDPKQDEVAACHLRDALEALSATISDQPTRYACSDTIVRGVVFGQRQKGRGC